MSHSQSEGQANALVHESSPYLLQHAYNPVDWHPWNEETLQKAKAQDKMLIVSIGYAACHWCHVMEHESFEDSTVAALMNEHFLPIKVDREERPDVDDIYMSAAQLVTGRGGWPLNAFALPDGRPVWAGTYFPKERWMDILRQFAELKANEPGKLEKSADQLTKGINSLDEVIPAQAKDITQQEVKNMATTLLRQMDQINGGRRGAPKFPMPNNQAYLLKYATTYGDEQVLASVLTTLDKMALGGIYDQVGGGFARYSVDDVWLVPHFEKMLYDNGQLVSLYSDAYRLTRDPLYKHVIEQSLSYVKREMTDGRGRFYSSLDADSEGEEGKFYVWSEEEINQLFVDERLSNLTKTYYNTRPDGNFEGHNILHVTSKPEAFAKYYDISIDELSQTIASANEVLLEARAKRVRPGLDDKILTSWNAMMIKGYVDAYKALQEETYLQTAQNAMTSLLADQMDSDHRLLRNYKGGKASINGFLDDYALTIDALLALYEVTFDESLIHTSKGLADYALAHFVNAESGLFFYTSDEDPALIARKSELGDNVIPGSNSVMARNLQKLGELLYNEDYLTRAKTMLATINQNIQQSQQPSYYSNWLQMAIDVSRPPYEIAIMGDDAQAVALEMMQSYRSDAIYLGETKESELPLLKYKYVDGETMIYVCQNKTCKLPVSDVQEALALME